jgi:hypothetical protein
MNSAAGGIMYTRQIAWGHDGESLTFYKQGNKGRRGRGAQRLKAGGTKCGLLLGERGGGGVPIFGLGREKILCKII